MTKREHTIGFGAPEVFGAHVFRVEIPSNKTDPILIIEDYGLNGGENGIPDEELRAIVPRVIWGALSDAARNEFNERLKEKKIATGRWKVGINILDRFLGRELCILVWASEIANPEVIPRICSRWSAFRPEERWWLFGMTAAEAGLPDDIDKGWRKALHFALSDGGIVKKIKRRRQTSNEADLANLSLFKD
jgi:hypothetical protein